MDENRYEKYKLFCQEEINLPIFFQSWWLDVVCGYKGWDYLEVLKDKKLVAVMPIFVSKKFGIINVILQPHFTKTSGIWIKYPKGQKYNTKLKFEKEIIDTISGTLASRKFHYFKQNFHYKFDNWLPFYLNGYKQTTFYTYVFNDLSNLDEIFKGFDSNIKTDIRKAEKLVEIKQGMLFEEFCAINEMTFKRQNIPVPYSYKTLEKLDIICTEKKCREIFYAIDEKSNIHAVAYLIWDENTLYYILGGGDPLLRNSGATSLLLWKAIQFAASIGKEFDFEGSMNPKIERFFRAFGGKQRQYFVISKENNFFLKIANAIR